jgi:hypothetical protein
MSQPGRLGGWILVGVVLGTTGDLAVARGEEPWYYRPADGHVVFTNVPSHPELRPVPGMEGSPAARRGSPLPATIYDPFILEVATELRLEPSLIKAVALVESGFDPHAVSPKGAQGLMQLMPATARQYGVSDPFDPMANLRAGALHLRNLLDEFGGDVTLALAAYNAGSGAVRRHEGVPTFRETRDYVRKVQQSMGRAPRDPAPATPPSRSDQRPQPARLRLMPDGSILIVN